MGWADCGTDRRGRPIGYAFRATCDHEGCDADIDRGLSFACGGMHGDNEACDKYFCDKHLRSPSLPDDEYDIWEEYFDPARTRVGMCDTCCGFVEEVQYREMMRTEAENRGWVPERYEWTEDL